MIKRFFGRIKELCKYALWRIASILEPTYREADDIYKGNRPYGQSVEELGGLNELASGEPIDFQVVVDQLEMETESK